MEYYEKNNNILKDYESNKITLEEYSELYSENYYYISKYTTSYSIVIIVCELLYFGVFQKYNNGQTLGKKIMRIKVVDNNDKGNVGVLRYFLRTIAIFFIYIGSVISLSINTILVFLIKLNYSSISMIVNYVFLFISLVSLIFILIRKDRRGIQDLLTNTKVVFEKK